MRDKYRNSDSEIGCGKYKLKSSFAKDLGDAFAHGPQWHRVLLQIIAVNPIVKDVAVIQTPSVIIQTSLAGCRNGKTFQPRGLGTRQPMHRRHPVGLAPRRSGHLPPNFRVKRTFDQ